MKIHVRLPRFYVMALGFLLVGLIGTLDYLTGFEFSFSLFYLIPVAFVTWRTDRGAGILIAVASGMAWFIADFLTSLHYAHPVAIYWNAAMILCFYLIVTLILSALKNSLEHENQLAHEIQQGLFPREIPQMPGCTITGIWAPSRFVTGDYFDVMKLSDDQIALCIADVAGHGMPAALLMSNLQAAVRIFAADKVPPREFCERLNHFILPNVMPGRFITFFYGVMDVANKTLQYTNAGHNPPILVHGDGAVVRLREGGALLGVLSNGIYVQKEMALMSGDRLLFFTDGIIEITNTAEDMFGETRLITLLQNNRELAAMKLQESVLAAVKEFGNGNFDDDVALLTIAIE
ncbi:MAG: hypothetical protein ALAOOOJD_01749 [bacterium]|nr:hypothetical protein [bacterium]